MQGGCEIYGGAHKGRPCWVGGGRQLTRWGRHQMIERIYLACFPCGYNKLYLVLSPWLPFIRAPVYMRAHDGCTAVGTYSCLRNHSLETTECHSSIVVLRPGRGVVRIMHDVLFRERAAFIRAIAMSSLPLGLQRSWRLQAPFTADTLEQRGAWRCWRSTATRLRQFTRGTHCAAIGDQSS
jgi:hypothetical protein